MRDSLKAFHYEFLQYILEELVYSVQSCKNTWQDKHETKAKKKNQLTSVMNAKSALESN